MPFTRLIITLYTAYPLVLEFTFKHPRWVLTSMWRQKTDRRNDDESYDFLSAITYNAKAAFGDYFKNPSDADAFLKEVKQRLMELLGTKAPGHKDTEEMQRAQSTAILQTLPVIYLNMPDNRLFIGSPIVLDYGDKDNPFCGDSVNNLVLEAEPPMS